MAVDTELVRIDNVEKELWDKIVESAEGGSTGGVLVVNAVVDETTGTATLDKTWKEIHDAAPAVWLYVSEKGYLPLANEAFDAETGGYWCSYDDSLNNKTNPILSFMANSENDYPVYQY